MSTKNSTSILAGPQQTLQLQHCVSQKKSPGIIRLKVVLLLISQRLMYGYVFKRCQTVSMLETSSTVKCLKVKE